MISQWIHAYLILLIAFSDISAFGRNPLQDSPRGSEFAGSEILATVKSSLSENKKLPDDLLLLAAASPERDESLQLTKRSVPLSLSFGPILFPAQLTPPFLSDAACLVNSNSVVESIDTIAVQNFPCPSQVPFNTVNEDIPVILPELAVRPNTPLSLSFGPILFPAQLSPPLVSGLAHPIIEAQNSPFTQKASFNSVNGGLSDILPLLPATSASEQEISRQTLTQGMPLSLSYGPIHFPAHSTAPFISQTAYLSTELPVSTQQVLNDYDYSGFPALTETSVLQVSCSDSNDSAGTGPSLIPPLYSWMPPIPPVLAVNSGDSKSKSKMLLPILLLALLNDRSCVCSDRCSSGCNRSCRHGVPVPIQCREPIPRDYYDAEDFETFNPECDKQF